MSKTITLPTELLRDAISTALRINPTEIGIARECLATAIMSDLEEAALPPLTEERIDWVATAIEDEIAADEAMAAMGEYGGERWGAETITTTEDENFAVEFGIGRVPGTIA